MIKNTNNRPDGLDMMTMRYLNLLALKDQVMNRYAAELYRLGEANDILSSPRQVGASEISK